PVPRIHVDVHERGSSEHPDEPLLTNLRVRLQRADVAYLRPPVLIPGGFDTRIYALQLAHVPPAFSGRLIVRIYPETPGGQRTTAEGTLQNALADAGYLVPRVVDICTDTAVLGGAFILMHCVEGQTLLAAMTQPSMLWRAPRLLARAHARLHALDPLPILRAVARAGVPSSLASTDDVLVRLQARMQVRGLEGLLPGGAWLAAHRPPAVGRARILHGDFHPGNVLVANGAVTGVIDWVAVGMPVTRHPPHRSRRAALPHRAPASGRNAQALRRIRMHDVGFWEPLGGALIHPLPGHAMALTAPS